MKKLFENWRKYVNESTEPDHLSDEAELAVHPDADVGQPEDDDNKKLLDIFWGSGAQAKQLAEMTGNMHMLQIFDKTIEAVKVYISLLDSYISGERPFDEAPHLIANSIEDHAKQIIHQVVDPTKHLARSYGTNYDNWRDTLYEAGDYVWYHGTPSSRVNIASEESSKSDYEELKRWAGV